MLNFISDQWNRTGLRGSYSFSMSFLTKNHSSNCIFTPFDIQFLLNPKKSWYFRNIHLRQIFYTYNTQTTPVTGILVSHYKNLRYKTTTPCPSAYIIGPQTQLRECLLSRLWPLREQVWRALRASWPVTCPVTKHTSWVPWPTSQTMALQIKHLASSAACPAERGPGLPTSTLEWNFTQNEEEGLHLFMDNK